MFCRKCKNDLTECEVLPTKDKEKVGKKIFASVVAIVLIAAIFTGVFVYASSPVLRITKAFEKTLFNSSTINLSFENRKFIGGLDAEVQIEFNQGIKGSVVECTVADNGKKKAFSVKDGIVYVLGKEKYNIFKSVEAMKADSSEEAKIKVAFVEALDKAIDGRLDKKTIKDFINNEYLPYASSETDEELPSAEDSEKALEKAIRKCLSDGTIEIETERVNGETVYDIETDISGVTDCILALSEEDKTVEAYVQAIVNAISEKTKGRISTKEELRATLGRLDSFETMSLDISITVNSSRITLIEIEDLCTIEIDSKK